MIKKCVKLTEIGNLSYLLEGSIHKLDAFTENLI